MVRRWGMYWGLVQVPQGVEFDTAFQQMRRWLARPIARKAVTALVVLEMSVFGGWLTLEHGQHLYQIGDQAIGDLRGQKIVYANICGSHGTRFVRLVFTGHRQASPLSQENLS
jgi:hypothetical protein